MNIRRWVIGVLVAFLVALVTLTGINAAGSPRAKVSLIQQDAKVAMLPLVDKVGVDLNWDLAQEIGRGVREKIGQKVEFVPAETENAYGAYDYIVHLELQRYEERDEELEMDVRVQVMAIKDDQPTVVHEEVIKTTHRLPRGNRLIDYNETNWGTPDYLFTPKSVAHARLSREVAERVDQVIA